MSTFNLNERKFTALFNSVHGQVNQETVFAYFQEDKFIWAKYSGGDIDIGTLSGQFISNDRLQFRYGHWDKNGEFRSGSCTSKLILQEDGRIRIHENWIWDDEHESGESTLIEIL